MQVLGRHLRRLGPDGRFVLPAPFRRGLGNSLVMVGGREEGHLLLVPAETFAEFGPEWAPYAYPAPIRQTGRVTIPPQLRELLALDAEWVVIEGRGAYAAVRKHR